MINYFNSKKINNEYLLTNDFGEYIFIKPNTYTELVNGTITSKDNHYEELSTKGFIIEGPLEKFVDEKFKQIRSMKSYCFAGTGLHIFALTSMCNLDCIYCQAHSKQSNMAGKMSVETGIKAIEFAMQSPNQNLTFEFQGGEPLLNFETIKAMIEHSKECNKKYNKNIEYTIVTNLTLLDDEKLKYIIDNKVGICTSLDGPEHVHNFNRPFRNNNIGSYKTLVEKIRFLRNNNINVNAIQTTSKESINYPKETIDEYLNLGFNNIFIRPLTPLGMADSAWDKVGYTQEEFMNFYRIAFEYIMELNKTGIRFVETHAMYFLKKILQGCSYNYMELRSPCGATLGQMSYYYDGNVFTCDEGRMIYEMGNESFCLGNVYDTTFNDVVTSKLCKALCKASIIESMPKCNDCVYQPYCGVCPVVNYAATNDLFSKNPRDYRCYVYKGIMDILFNVIKQNDKETMDILWSWIN